MFYNCCSADFDHTDRLCGKSDEITDMTISIDGRELKLAADKLLYIYNATKYINEEWNFPKIKTTIDGSELSGEGNLYQNLVTGMDCDCLEDFRYGHHYVFRFPGDMVLPEAEILLYICKECNTWFMGLLDENSEYPM